MSRTSSAYHITWLHLNVENRLAHRLLRLLFVVWYVFASLFLPILPQPMPVAHANPFPPTLTNGAFHFAPAQWLSEPSWNAYTRQILSYTNAYSNTGHGAASSISSPFGAVCGMCSMRANLFSKPSNAWLV